MTNEELELRRHLVDCHDVLAPADMEFDLLSIHHEAAHDTSGELGAKLLTDWLSGGSI